jgi:methyl-galactoside transport system substrate-binding protein
MERGGLSLLAVSALALGLLGLAAGCAERERADRPMLGVALSSRDDSFIADVEASLRRHAKGKALLSVSAAHGRQAEQDLAVDSLLAAHSKALAISLVDAARAGPLVEKAKTGRVPAVFFSTRPEAADLVKWDKVLFVGTKPGSLGQAQGEMAAAFWAAHPEADLNHDGRMQYQVLSSASGFASEVDESLFTADALKAARIEAVQAAWPLLVADRKAATLAMAALISRPDAAELVFCDSALTSLGASDAAEEAASGKKGRPRMAIVAMGGDPAVLDAIRKGEVLGTVLVDAESEGQAVFELAHALALGKDPSGLGWTINENKYVWMPCLKVTREGVGGFLRR